MGKMIKNFNENKISVALCTYNGGLYLREQLESILKQTLSPDEVIVCDDFSTDATIKILEEFKRKSFISIKVYYNKENLGVSKNFEKAISLCSGDIIFLSDQDDIWLPNKIEKICKVFETNLKCSYVFSDAYIVDKNLKSLGYTMFQSINFNKFKRKQFYKKKQLNILLRGNIVTGGTLAFRSKMKDFIIPVPKIWLHDAWIAIIGSILGEGCFIEKPLIYYRQHRYQLNGGKRLGIKEKLKKGLSRNIVDYVSDIQKYKILNDRIMKISGKINKEIENKILFLLQRIKIYKTTNIFNMRIIFQESFNGRYFKYSTGGFKSIIKDIFTLFKNYITIN